MRKQDPLYIRRCHVCFVVNENSGEHVTHCQQCRKPLAPFYFFEDSEVSIETDNFLRVRWPDGIVRPLRGFTAYW